MQSSFGPEGERHHAWKESYDSKTGKRQQAELRSINGKSVWKSRTTGDDGKPVEQQKLEGLKENEVDEFMKRWNSETDFGLVSAEAPKAIEGKK
jgi:hypothetical protein